MKTANELLEELPNRAFAQREAVKSIVDQGYGDCEIVNYYGQISDRKGSNGRRVKDIYRDKGYEIVAEEAGPKMRYKTEGFMVFVAIKKVA